MTFLHVLPIFKEYKLDNYKFNAFGTIPQEVIVAALQIPASDNKCSIISSLPAGTYVCTVGETSFKFTK